MTEAVTLMVRYLLETKPINRIRLVIDPDNVGSRRVADRCGFRPERTARSSWYTAPGARTRPSGTTPDLTSLTPVCTVVRDAPDRRATNPIPPQPIASASTPNSSRHCRSSKCGRIVASFSANASSVITPLTTTIQSTVE
jgi:hypothetical protein